FFFQAEDGIRDFHVTGVQTCALPISMLLQEAMEQLGSKSEETVMIGDGLHVDILAGKNAGTHTLLVLSGSSSREDVEASSIKPRSEERRVGKERRYQQSQD